MNDSAYQKLRQIFRTLRDPVKGCPWDLKQTHQSLIPYLIEESYEFIDAIRSHPEQMKEELGDVLLQIVLHSQIAEDNGTFSLEEVMNSLSEKMITRHPHVFGETTVSSSDEVLKNWNAIKSNEKENSSVLHGVGRSLPGLLRASELGKKAATVGLDWKNSAAVIHKIKEEIDELELTTSSEEHEDELGDLFFALAQYARHKKINAEVALQKACDKFKTRVEEMEKLSDAPLATLTEAGLDSLWERAKKESGPAKS